MDFKARFFFNALQLVPSREPGERERSLLCTPGC